MLHFHVVIFHEGIVQDLEDHTNQIQQLSYHSMTVIVSISLNLDHYSYAKDEIRCVAAVDITISVDDLIVKKLVFFSLLYFLFSLYL